jgi:L-alanine-DL-glutamate epimerase-like enolase superfamily enzyme
LAVQKTVIGDLVRRRDFLKALPAVTVVPRLLGARIKITDIRVLRLRTIKEVGSFQGYLGPGDIQRVRIGGGSFVEVHTDQGLVGIGPGMDPAQLPSLKAQLVGRDPFDVEILVAAMRAVQGIAVAGSPLGAFSAVEIALWDIIGKASNQPLYKLWGAAKDRVPPYASQMRLSTPEERARLAAQLKSDGWHAIKYRSHFPTFKEDIRLVEAARKAVGDEMDIMCDANQATNGFLTPGVTWDFRRAVETARAYQQWNVYWLEEPLPRFDFDHLAELNRLVEIPIAGGEGNHGLHEFRWLLEKGCFDIVQPEVLLEGPQALRKIAVLAESMNKQCVPHVGDGGLATICNLHLVASWPNSPYLEVYHDLPMREYSNGFAIFEEPPLLDQSGYLNLPQKPGLGVSVNKDLILSA